MKRKSWINTRHGQSLLILAALAVGIGAALLTHSPEPLAPLAVVAPEVKPDHKSAPLFAPVKRTASGPDIRPAHQYVKKSETPKFVETTAGTFEASGDRYLATLSDSDGLTYHPRMDPRFSGADAPAEKTSLRVQLQKMQCGEVTAFERDALDDADEVPVEDASGGISFWRTPNIEEVYLARGDGVEQFFRVDQRPEGNGDLKIVCLLETENLTPESLSAAKTGPVHAGGIQFKDSNGKVAARYGQVVVRDSGNSGHGCVIEPLLSADASEISFSVPAGFLNRAVYPIIIDPLVGNDFAITDNVPTTVTQPALAASTTQYLVAWNDLRAGNGISQVFGGLVSTSGIPSPNIPLSNPVGVPNDFRFQRTTVASDGSNFLVVWSDDRQVGAGIRGALVQSTGALLDGDDFLIAPTTGAVFEDPLVTYNGTDFIVTWSDVGASGSGPAQIYFTRVTPAKIIGLTNLIPAVAAPINQAALFLAPQKPSGDTLLVYRENNEVPAATRSVRIAPDGTLRDPGGTVLFKEDPDGGFGQPIGATWTGLEWQILSSFGETIDSSVYAHRLTFTGIVTPPSGVFAEVGVGPAGTPSEPFAPAFAGNGEWLFLRDEKISGALFHIIGKRVTFNGVDRDPVPFQVDNATQGILRDAAAVSLGNNYLAVWLDGRSGGAQPGDARDVVGAIIDSTAAGAIGSPLTVVAHASPTTGEAPLVVSFDSTGSTSAYDTLLWDFGDGTTSDSGTVTKTYNNNGTYNAVLRLTKNGYTVSDRVVIKVGTGQGPGTGGTRVGTPVTNTPGLVTEIFISTAAIRLNFAADNLDVLRITGILDQGLLPTDLTGKNATVSIGGFTTVMPLDAKGQFKSPDINFAVSPAGGFGFQVVNGNFQGILAALGLVNEDIKPPIIINVPITVTIDTFTATATIGASYKSTRNDNGAALYQFLDIGDEVSGSFLITKFSASEMLQPKTGAKVHTYSVKGQLVQPGGGKFKPALAGEYRVSIGEFTLAVPVGQFRVDGGKLKFVARVGISGLKKFSIDLNSGQFNLQMLKVPAEGKGGSQLFVAKTGDGITNVDLAFSIQLSLENGDFSAGRYIFISRKDLKAKNWKLR